MTLRIGINGFGRMGRALFRIVEEHGLDIDVVAVNELGPATTTVNLLARDSVHGRCRPEIVLGEGGFGVGDRWVRLLDEPDPEALPWGDLGVKVVGEATGRFRTRESAAGHLAAGAERVVVSAPCKGADATFVIGVNEAEF